MTRHVHPGQLTSREIEVLDLIAEGQSNSQIGRQLGIAESTVKQHVAVILACLHAVSRAHAIHRAHTLGLLPVTAPADDDTEALAAQVLRHINDARAINRRLHELNEEAS